MLRPTSHHPVVTLAPQRLFPQLKLQQCCAIQANKKKARKHCLFMFNSYPEGRVLFVVFGFSFFPQYVYHRRRHSLLSLSACPQGTFKSFQGAGLCQQCPLNSRSTIEAATLCGCRNGYYRGDMDKPEDMCTSESLSLSVV